MVNAKSKYMNIQGRRIGGGEYPLFVAEIGANHDGSFATAEKMMRQLAHHGVEAVKLQLYTSQELVADGDRVVTWGPSDQTRSETIGGLFDRLSLSREAIADLLVLGRELGLLAFATPFSCEGVDFLARHNVPCFKIAASDVGHLPLLRHVAQTEIPIILSLGKCTLGEAERAVYTLRENGCRQLGLLHCVAEYPAPVEEMNLRTLGLLGEMFPDTMIGLSDHSIGNTAAIVAVALGASLVEKHVTQSRAGDGPDHWFSIEIEEIPFLQQQMREAAQLPGRPRSGVLPCELTERATSTRSLVARKDIAKHAVVTADDLKIVRPGTGIQPMFFENILGLRTTRKIKKNTPVRWKFFK